MTTSGWSSFKADWNSMSPLGQIGVVGAIGGTIQGIVSSYYAAQTAKYQTKSLALQYEHKRDMTLFNRRMKESQAQHLNDVYNKQYQIATMKAGNRESTARASFAARGIQMGVGSTKDAFVSSKILSEIDKLTMNSNKVRAISNKRLEAEGLRITANQYGVSAQNMFATASSIDPFMNMSSSLLTGVGNIIQSLPANMLKA